MGQVGPTLADAASVGLGYASRLLTDIPQDRFARLAAPGNQVIQANHPAFILGHLSLYPWKVVQLLNFDADITRVKPSENYESLFSKQATCVDDPQQSIYPASDEITAFFEGSYQIALDALRSASDEQLAAPSPDDSPMKKKCPTLGGVLAFYVTGHVTTHLGQLSTWRRMQGLAPV